MTEKLWFYKSRWDKGLLAGLLLSVMGVLIGFYGYFRYEDFFWLSFLFLGAGCGIIGTLIYIEARLFK